MKILSEAYLRDCYEQKRMSIGQIAEEAETYPNRVRRQLKKYNIIVRDKSEAQKLALSSGRHKHPTKGKKHTDDVKVKISEKMAKVWKNLSKSEYEERSSIARKQWDRMTEKEKIDLRTSASEAVRLAATEGSRLEKYLLINLRGKGYQVQFHSEQLLNIGKLHMDLFLPELKTVIEIDGPAHFFPIWGEKNLQKHLQADLKKTGLLIQAGYVIIRVKHIVKTLSKVHERRVLKNILVILDSIKKEFPDNEHRLIELEVK